MRIFSIKRAVVSVFVFFVILQTQAIKQSWALEESQFGKAQELVEGMVSKHPDLARLTIHAVPTGEEASRIIACNIKDKIGNLSDPEDLEAMKTGETVVLREGDNLDVTAPIWNKAGKPIAATGITLRLGKEETESDIVKKATAIAKELNTAIQNTKKPLW